MERSAKWRVIVRPNSVNTKEEDNISPYTHNECHS